MGQQFLQSGIGRHALQRRLGPCAFLCDRACRGDQSSAGNPEREVFGVTAAKPSEADDPDANRFRRLQALPSEYWPNRGRRSGRLKAACLPLLPTARSTGRHSRLRWRRPRFWFVHVGSSR